MLVTIAELPTLLVRTGVPQYLPSAVDTASWGLRVAAEGGVRVSIELGAVILFG